MEITEAWLNSLGSSCQSPLGAASVSVVCRCLRAYRTLVPVFRQQEGGRSSGNGLKRESSSHFICNAYTAAVKISVQTVKAD